MGDPEDQLRAGELLWVLTRAGIHLQGVPFSVVIEIGNLLADGIAKGLATQTIAEQIAPLLDGDIKRALLIVRTERARAVSGAEWENAKDAGDYDKEWMDDATACPICRANAAQGAIPITRPFQGGALYPPQHPNCRCALQPVAHQATTEKTLMPNDVVYAVIGELTKSRVDDDGVLTFEASKATGPDLDGDGQRVSMAWAIPAMREWFATGGNLREQHDPKRAIGRALSLEERPDGVYISGRVVDPVTIAKVNEGLLPYLSIGVKGHQLDYTQKALAPGGLITGGRIVECSLVDRGSNPTAKLVLAKAEGPDDHLAVGGELVKFHVEPDLLKMDFLDDDSPLCALTKAIQADPVFAADYRRRMLEPTPLEKSVGAMEQDIAKVLAYVEPRAHFRSRNGSNGHRVLVAPPQPQSSEVAVSAHRYSYDEPESPQTRELRKAVDADPRRDARVANIRRLLGITEAQERARTQALENSNRLPEIRH